MTRKVILTRQELKQLQNTARVINLSGVRPKLTPEQEATLQHIEKTLKEHGLSPDEDLEN